MAAPALPSDAGRNELITKLAHRMDIEPTEMVVDMARTLWVDATRNWRSGRGPKPDVAHCIRAASAAAARTGSSTLRTN